MYEDKIMFNETYVQKRCTSAALYKKIYTKTSFLQQQLVQTSHNSNTVDFTPSFSKEHIS